MALFKVGNRNIEFEDLLKEIYMNSADRREKINSTFKTVSDFIKDLPSAVNLLPEVTKLQQVGVSNDDALIKLALVISKQMSKKSDDDTGDFVLTAAERKQLDDLARQTTEIPGGSK